MTANQRPYLAAYGLIRVGDTILVQRRANTGYLDGYWAVPSGHVQEGEDAVSAVSRELHEETGLVVAPQDWSFVCAMHRRTDRTIIDLFFAATRFSRSPRICERDKCDGLAFVPVAALPAPFAGYVRTAIDCLVASGAQHARYHGEGWS
ncbi:MAG: NUDIX domain-containing protein [Hyphomicrobiaceae bacterium]|nr:NUDIX domain-containing protein [Hyphomicrobiaceae bacterium]